MYGEKTNTYSFWFKRDPKTGDPIPVTYEMQGYNNLLGAHYDHYIVWNYSSKPIIDKLKFSTNSFLISSSNRYITLISEKVNS